MSARSGRHAPRSKNGCSTCRIRKVKCDETRPICSKCSQARLQCDWDRPIPSRRPVANHAAKRKDVISTRTAPLRPAGSTDNDNRSQVSGDRDHADTEEQVHDPKGCLSLATSQPADRINPPPPFLTEHFEMPNSLVLDGQDFRAFQYVPESLMVLRFGKPWRWSMLSYVHNKIAPRESGVMSAFIAVASMELRFRDLIQYDGTIVTQASLNRTQTLRNNAAKYFHLAIRELSALLNRLSRIEPEPEELEALFAMWFLILHCELYDPDLIRASQIHLNGIRSFVAKLLQDDDGSGRRALPPACQQLLLFITYLDVNLALGNLNGGQLSLDLLSIPRESPLAYDRIWEASRTCLPKMWGSEYPAEEIIDDVENYRGLSFLHAGQKLKLSVWQLAIAIGKGRDVADSRQRLWTKIEEIGDEFNDILTLGKVAKSSGGRRVMWTVYHGCLDYYAVRVLYSCLDKDDPSPKWLDTTLSDLLAVAHKSIGEDSQQLYRTSWSLAVALLKVRDPIHRDWIQTQLRRARVLLSGVGLPLRLIDEPSTPESLFIEYSQNSPVEEIE